MREIELISAGVMNTYWEQQRTDMLDLLMPFLKYSISQTSNVTEEIDLDVLTAHFRTEYGYSDIPITVIRIMLNRLSPSILKRKNGKYFLSTSLSDEVLDYDKKKRQYKERIEKVINALKEHLNTEIQNLLFDYDKTSSALYGFFINNGLRIAQSTDSLSALKYKDGRVNYEIARFILQEYKNSSSIFDCILDMVQGFFVSTAISVQSPKAATINGKIKDCQCFIDTRIIIDALGLHSEEARKCARDFLDMLKKSGATLKTFDHIYDEITDVLKAYKSGIENPRTYYSLNTLEFFDEHCYSFSDVDRYITLLRKKVEQLGISIEKRPEHSSDLALEAIIDEQQLEKNLLDELHYNQRSMKNAVQNDVDSASSIVRLRNGYIPTEIENAKFIFVSSNTRYCDVVSRFLNQNWGECIPAVMSDCNLSAVLWLKNYSTHKDYPKNRLLENAMIAIEPNKQFMSCFIDSVDKLLAEGGISEDEAVILRTDLFYKREAVRITQGNAEQVTPETVKIIRDKLKNTYTSKADEEIKLKYEQYMSEKRINTESRRKAFFAIESEGDIVFDRAYKRGIALSRIVFSLLFLTVVILLLCGLRGNQSGALTVGVILGIITALGAWDSLSVRRRFIEKFIKNAARKKANIAMDKKRNEYESILGTLSV